GARARGRGLGGHRADAVAHGPVGTVDGDVGGEALEARARVERLQLLLELLELLPRRFGKPGPPRAVEGADRVEVRAVGLAVDLDPERHEGGGGLRDGGGEAADE